MNDQTFSDITPEMIQDWKAKHGEDSLCQIEVVVEKTENPIDQDKPVQEKLARYIAKTPTRTVMDLVGQHGVNKDVVKGNKVLTANCILGGDMAILESNGGVYTAVLGELRKLVTTKEVRVKKL